MAPSARKAELGDVQGVRFALNDAENSLPKDVIDYHLSKARGVVDDKAGPNADRQDLVDAVEAVAALKVVRSDRELKQAGGDGEQVTWNADGFREGLKEDKEEALDAIQGFWSVTR